MARQGTTYLNLGKWLDGENPGSGPQDGTLSDGLNGDKNKIDKAIGAAHNADGSHKAGVIDAANLAPTAVDGVTLEQDTPSKKLRVKDGGVSSVKLAAAAVTKGKLAADTAGAGMKQNADGSLSPRVDGMTIVLNEAGSLQALYPSVTLAKEYSFGVDRGTLSSGSVWGMIHGVPSSPSRGYILRESGRLNRLRIDWEGACVSYDIFDLAEINVAAGQTLSVLCTLLVDEDASQNLIFSIQPVIYIAGSAVFSLPAIYCPAKQLGSRYGIITVEI